MKNNRFIAFIIFIFSLSSCDSEKKRQEKFNEFCSSVNIIELPLTINCSFDSINNQTDTNYFRDFIPEGHAVIGQLKTDNNNVLFLFGSIGDIIYPSIFSFKANGELLDHLSLDSCKIETRIEAYYQTTISKNLNIKVTEDLKYFTYMGHGTEYIRGMDSSVRTTDIIEYTKDGSFNNIKR